MTTPVERFQHFSTTSGVVGYNTFPTTGNAFTPTADRLVIAVGVWYNPTAGITLTMTSPSNGITWTKIGQHYEGTDLLIGAWYGKTSTPTASRLEWFNNSGTADGFNAWVGELDTPSSAPIASAFASGSGTDTDIPVGANTVDGSQASALPWVGAAVEVADPAGGSTVLGVYRIHDTPSQTPPLVVTPGPGWTAVAVTVNQLMTALWDFVEPTIGRLSGS